MEMQCKTSAYRILYDNWVYNHTKLSFPYRSILYVYYTRNLNPAGIFFFELVIGDILGVNP